uniref:Major facilitator superfamily (MFS) profile domain-containing protein n=1 Tax=Graphocephala atropunctata TaxID=36148 RepID=A0A1B6LVE2_9HEMI
METEKEDRKYGSLSEGSHNLEEQRTEPNRKYLYISVAILNLVFVMCGVSFAWSSPMLMKLHLSTSDGSTVASAMPLGLMMGPFVSGALLDRVGRRATVGLSMAVMTCCYVILTLCSSVSLLSLGRFLGGITGGITFAAVPVYIAEISDVR